MINNEEYDYVILCNDIDRVFLAKYSEYPIIDDIPFSELIEKLEFNTNKRIVFNDTFYGYRSEEVEEIMDLMKRQSIKFVLITSNIEHALYGDYISVYDGNNIVLEGLKEVVLKEEKKLKHLGYGLPFVVDLSIQLTYYDVSDKVYFDMDKMVDDLWN